MKRDEYMETEIAKIMAKKGMSEFNISMELQNVPKEVKKLDWTYLARESHPVCLQKTASFGQHLSFQEYLRFKDNLGNERLICLGFDSKVDARSKKMADFGGQHHRNIYYRFEDGNYTMSLFLYEGHVFQGLPEFHEDFAFYVEEDTPTAG